MSTMHCNQFWKIIKSLVSVFEKFKAQKSCETLAIYGYGWNNMFFTSSLYTGFKTVTKACCGVGGEYNFINDSKKMCGAPGVPFCSDPQRYIFWDGYHFTQNAYKHLAKLLIEDILPKFQCRA